MLSSRERLERAWSFREPDRVPIELGISSVLRDWPSARRVRDFVDNEADNFRGAPVADWGFFGLPSQRLEDVIEEVPGVFHRKRITQRTPIGDFHAIVRHSADVLDPGDFHWERRFINTLDEMARLADAPRAPIPILNEQYEKACARIGDRGLPMCSLPHALGALVRQSATEEVYGWMLTEPGLIHRFLDTAYAQQIQAVLAMGRLGMRPVFVTHAYEMLTPPWIGPRLFEEFVAPYDTQLHRAIHGIGARVRAHCHGSCFRFLSRFRQIGVDAIEPLEPPPFGDTDLAEAKRLVGEGMLLSGNIPSQMFHRWSVCDVRDSIRNAVRAAARGGGFTLRLSGGDLGPWNFADKAESAKAIENVEAYIDAAREFGRYA